MEFSGPCKFNGNTRNIQCNARNIHSSSFLATALINKSFLSKTQNSFNMKSRNFTSTLFAFIASITIFGSIYTQTSYTIGDGTSSTTGRLFVGSKKDGYCQMYFSSSDLSSLTTGQITEIAWDASTVGGTFNNTQIQIQEYASNPLESVTSGYTLCWTGTASISVGWNTFTLTTPFDYTAGNGLLVRVCFDNNATVTEPSFRYTYISSQVKYRNGNSGDYCTSTAETSSSFRPNTKFTFAPISCEQPQSLSSSSVTATSADINWTAPSSAPANGYEYYYSNSSTEPTSGTTASGSVGAGITTANISGLSATTQYYFWVRSNCDIGDLSYWTSGGTFTTPCGTSSMPYSEGFNDTSIPSCWSSEIVSGSGTYLSYVTSGSNPTTSPQESTHWYNTTPT